MNTLYFSRDGVLRYHAKAWDPDEEAHKGRPVPLIGWQEAIDAHAFLKALHSPIRFEDGLTVRELFENLAPWAEQMTGIACMDFPAFLAEVRRAPSDEDMSDLSHIELSWCGQITPVPAFTRPRERVTKDRDGVEVFHIGNPKKTGRIGLASCWNMDVRLKEKGSGAHGGAQGVSLSFCPISDWAHLELRILGEGRLYDETAMRSNRVFMGTAMPLTNAEHPLVRAEVQPTRGPRVMACDPPIPTFFDALVRGLLWEIGFEYSPTQRDNLGVEVREGVAEAKASLEGSATVAGPEAGMSRHELRQREEFSADMRCIREAEAAAARLGFGRPARVM